MFTECPARALHFLDAPSSPMYVVPTPSVTEASTASKISIQTHLLGTQTKAIIQISTWSLNSFSLFFNFDPAPPPSLKRAKTTAQQVGQAKQASFVHFCPFSSLLRWGTERPHRLWKAAALGYKPSFLRGHKNSGMKLFPPPTFTLRHDELATRTFSFPLPLERIC